MYDSIYAYLLLQFFREEVMEPKTKLVVEVFITNQTAATQFMYASIYV